MSLSRPQYKPVHCTCQFPGRRGRAPTSDSSTLEYVHGRWLVTVPSMIIPAHVDTAMSLPEVLFQVLKLVSKGLLGHVHLLTEQDTR